MPILLADLIESRARITPDAPALVYKAYTADYGTLWERCLAVARGLIGLHVHKGERVAVYLEKRPETVEAIFGAAAAGAVFVPVNPLLRSRQVAYILRDCAVRVLITSADRLSGLQEELADCPDLRAVVLVDDAEGDLGHAGASVLPWSEMLALGNGDRPLHRVIDVDMAAILYTSGSTGMPKGVVLSHRNIVAGAVSVSTYLENTADDRILAVLPLSFDAGFSQMTTAFNAGATLVLHNYLLARDVVRDRGSRRSIA